MSTTTPTNPNPSPGYPPYGAPAPAPAKKSRRWLWILVGVGIFFFALIGGCAVLVGGAAVAVNEAADEATQETADGGISTGIGSEDATADIGTPTMDAPDAIGVSYIHIPVTNNSEGRSDYFIEMVIESADGATQYETASAFLEAIEAGQSATAETMVAWGSDPAPADATLRVTTVQRTASV